MTEDDTFRILARPDVHELMTLYQKNMKKRGSAYTSIENVSFCKYHGWRWREFLQEARAAGINHELYCTDYQKKT